MYLETGYGGFVIESGAGRWKPVACIKALRPNELLERGNRILPALVIELNDFRAFACEIIVIKNSDVHSI